MRLPLRTLLDPAAERLDLRRAEAALSARDVGHPPLLVRVRDATEQLAPLGAARDDRDLARGKRRLRDLLAVEPQAPLTAVPVGPVAGVAVVGQDRSHVPVEGDERTVGPNAGRVGGHRPRRGGGSPRVRRHPDHQSVRPGDALVDPAHQGPDLAWCERVGTLRHPLVRIFRQEPLVEQAAFAVATHDGPAGVAALEQAVPRVETETALRACRAVAAHAGGGQDGLDVSGEVERGGGRRGGRRPRRCQRTSHPCHHDGGAGGCQDPAIPHSHFETTAS